MHCASCKISAIYIRKQKSHVKVGVSTGRVGSSLCPTRTRPECGGWIKNWPETDPEIWLDFRFGSRRFRVDSGRFRVDSGRFRVYHRGRNLAGSGEIWPKSDRILRYLAKIWPDTSRSDRNMAGSVEIWPKSNRILRYLAEIWLDPSRSNRNLAGFVEIWPRFRRVTAGSRRIWSENRNTSPVRINDRFGSGVTGLETKNR